MLPYSPEKNKEYVTKYRKTQKYKDKVLLWGRAYRIKNKEAIREYQKKYLKDNPQQFKDTARRFRRARLDLLRLLKDSKGGKCEQCGYEINYSCLDFHHLRDKKFNVNAHTVHRMSIEELNEEVSKCILLCRNCHTDLHYPQNRK